MLKSPSKHEVNSSDPAQLPDAERAYYRATWGPRGEILMKKNVRTTAGIQPGDKIYIEASDGQILIRKVYSIDEIFCRPPIVTGTPESIED